MSEILASLWFFLPAAIANMMPVVMARIFGKSSLPIDFGIKVGKDDVFGRNKTWRGFITGVLAAIAFYALQRYLHILGFSGWSIIDYSQYLILPGFLLGFGALAGDLAKSFVKRRLRIKPGERFFMIDQLDYLIGAFIVTSPLIPITASKWGIIFVGYFIFVIIVNHISYFLGIRDERW